jgi:hypothetical protein|tara:strand:+ start:31407 stop:32903 length:1497 start_codon:yes stop_codon:yes gene_type:complete
MSIFQDNIFERAVIAEKEIAGLKTKSKESGIAYGILKQVYDRGMAAWKTGHRPGTTSQQWAFARVNSFISKGSGTWGKADKDLAAKVKKEAVEEDKNMKDDGNYMKGVKKDKKDDREAQFKKQAKMSDDDPDAYKPAPGDKDADGELKKTKLSKHTKKYHQMYNKETTMSIFTGDHNIFAEAKMNFRNERDVEKHKQNLLMAMEIAVDAEGDYTGAMKQIEKLERGLSKNPSVAAALKFYAEDVEFPEDIKNELEEKGLWANIHAKRKRGEKMRNKGDKGAPSQDAIKKAQGEDIDETSRFLKYSDLMKQKADMIGQFGKAAFMKPEMKKVDRLIKKELKKLGMEEEVNVDRLSESTIGDKLKATDDGDSVDTDIIDQDPMKFHNPRFGKPIVAHCVSKDDGHFDFVFYSDGKYGFAAPGHRENADAYGAPPDEEAFMFDHKPNYNDFKKEAMKAAKGAFNSAPMRVLKFDTKIRVFKDEDGESQFDVRRLPKTPFRG